MVEKNACVPEYLSIPKVILFEMYKQREGKLLISDREIIFKSQNVPDIRIESVIFSHFDNPMSGSNSALSAKKRQSTIGNNQQNLSANTSSNSSFSNSRGFSKLLKKYTDPLVKAATSLVKKETYMEDITSITNASIQAGTFVDFNFDDYMNDSAVDPYLETMPNSILITNKLLKFHFYFYSIQDLLSFRAIINDFEKTNSDDFTGLNKSSSSDHSYLTGVDLEVLSKHGVTIKANQQPYSNLKNILNCRITYTNKEYGICTSYSDILMVPDNLTDQMIVDSSKMHYFNRFPIIGYITTGTKSMLLHCSNIIPSATNPQIQKCIDDEMMLFDLANSQNVNKITVYQFVNVPSSVTSSSNTRFDSSFQQSNSTSNFQANSMNTNTWTLFNYSPVVVIPSSALSRIFDYMLISLDIIPQKSFKTDINLSSSSIDSSVGLFQDLLFTLLKLASKISNEFAATKAINVLVEDSGIDYVLVVSSLVKIMHDSASRTIDGFLNNFADTWFKNGYPFADRHKILFGDAECHLYYNSRNDSQFALKSDRYTAPTVLVLLSCIRQLLVLYPNIFEFNENLLLNIFYELNSPQTRSLLKNNQCERSSLDKIELEKLSFWSNILKQVKNHFYAESKESIDFSDKLKPMNMTLWDSLFLFPNIHLTTKFSTQLYNNKVDEFFASTKT